MVFPDIPNAHALVVLLLPVVIAGGLGIVFLWLVAPRRSPSATLSFVTPMAYKTNLLVMNAGGYKFIDFVKVGIPLTVIMWLGLTAILALAYDL